jgi:acyl-CoA thioesterase FadM
MEELLKEYKIVLTAKVQWGDMDAMQHVNNKVYVNLMGTSINCVFILESIGRV